MMQSAPKRIVFFSALAAALALAACEQSPLAPSAAVGDAERGRLLLRQYGCGNCHRIPGVAAAQGTVGPPLDRMSKRVYLAGTLPNSAQHMVRWIRAPDAVKPQTAMPNLKVSEPHAKDMVAHLYSLR